ncbi:hypothetical protein BDY19DRAFT_925845 [Irpex rosettiformis]|uniref:Uncharacterized protein n=1 Tax=Irpex rosettiformis TaxID=378272 RepID=A0ACB8UEP8_9APHY|nr:hypothetical protein BDY19DRAFT_925845 [Irpex rosettiformis]
MNIIALFIIAVAALFNIGQLPQPLPTVYQLTLNGVESAICDSSFPSSRRGTVCNILGVLRLPSAPVTLTIVAPPPPPPPPTASSPPVDTNSSLSDEPSPESNRRLPPSVVSTSLIVSPMVSTQWTFPTWTLPASPSLDTILTLFYCLFTTFWVGFIAIIILRNEDDPRKSIVRWLTWFFYDRFKPLRRTSPEGSLYYKNDIRQVDSWSYYEIRWHFFNQNSPVIRFIRPVIPGPEPSVIEEPQVEATEPEPEPRKHVRSAARCQRIRRQKAKARVGQQEPVPAEEPEVVEEPVAPRRNTRGGKQVRKRQRRQEQKEARRAAANAEAGPSTRPAVVPEFNDDNFPALPGTNIEPKAVQYEYPFATIAAVRRPSPTAAIRKGSWTIKVNPDAESVPRPEVKRSVVGNRVEGLEDRWIDLEEEVWRNGRRKRKKNR